MSEYKPGDRLKVTFEAEVTHTDEDGIRVVDQSHTPHVFAWVFPEHVEKLPDPEPEWKYGTVVKVEGQYMPFWYAADPRGWQVLGGKMNFSDIISRAWSNGTLTILWQPEGD